MPFNGAATWRMYLQRASFAKFVWASCYVLHKQSNVIFLDLDAKSYSLTSLSFLPFNCHIKTAEQRPLKSNTLIGTLAVDGWAVTFGKFCTARRGLGGH